MKTGYDVIIVGTGMGGCAAAYKLMHPGRKILLLDKGMSLFDPQNVPLVGQQAELAIEENRLGVDEAMRRSLRWQTAVLNSKSFSDVDLKPYLGAGSGGSSALYGAGLERLWEIDFSPKRKFNAIHDSSLPDSWPISYADLAPYYEEAETLMHVVGDKDSLNPLAIELGRESYPLSSRAEFMQTFLNENGLHPYRTHLGISKPKECKHCVGFLCVSECKMDGARTFLKPFINSNDLTILSDATVRKLLMNKSICTGVEVEMAGETIDLYGETIIVSAGALASPCILLNSKSSYWPLGVGNNHDLVGRNLMRHLVDFYFLKLPVSDTEIRALSDFSFSDYYLQPEGRPFGSVKSSCGMIPYKLIESEVKSIVKKRFPVLLPVFNRFGNRAMRWYLEPKLKGYTWCPILEDLPYHTNRVSLTTSGEISLSYTLGKFERGQIRDSRKAYLNLFKDFSPFLLKQAESNKFLAHSCGTCRFGNDPKSSVLDANNKVHGTENLYVADASFFPSSTGCNPSLTIAANSLRVGDFIRRKLGA